MADLGAQVIKIEAPSGDSMRYTQRQPLSPEGKPQQNGECIDHSFTLDNRGKRSVAVDLTDSRGQALVQDLAKKADVFLTNLLPGRLAKYGMGYDQINAVNPGVVYASVSGWGLKGPDVDKLAFDMTAFFGRGGGLNLLMGNGPPIKPRSGAGDHQTGLATLNAILAALLLRQTTGKGSFCETSLLRTSTWNLGEDLAACLVDRQIPPKSEHTKDHPMVRLYKTSDERWIMVCMPMNFDFYWPKFCSALGRPEWISDERYSTNSKRVAARVELGSAIQEIIATDTMASWIHQLSEAGCIAGPLSELPEVVDDPQLRLNGAFQEVTHPVAGSFDTVAAPFRISGADVYARGPGPEPGADTAMVLREHLGIGDDRIQELTAAGVVGFSAKLGSPLANWTSKVRSKL